jgi:hypothetical protein
MVMQSARVSRRRWVGILLALWAALGSLPWAAGAQAAARPGASAQRAAFASPSPAGWTNVTGNLGGATWGYAGVTLLASVPESPAVIAGVSERGLWINMGGATSWRKLGALDREPITNRPHRILFDPGDRETFWVSGCYGPGIFKTIDSGRSFDRLGRLEHVDGIAVDFSDSRRQTMLVGLHEQVRSLHLSRDGGRTWRKIGDRLPANSNFTSDPVILNTRTFLINTAGWKQGATWGIYRSEDGGDTWTQVSKAGATGTPLVASNGAIYWQALWSAGLTRSTDRGTTWTAPGGPVKTNPIELPDRRLAGLAGVQILLSSDGAATWTRFGPPIPFDPSGIVFSARGKCFYAWRMSNEKDPKAVARLDVQ